MERLVEAGDQAIEPTGTIVIDSDEDVAQKDLAIFLNDVQVKTETVEFVRG